MHLGNPFAVICVRIMQVKGLVFILDYFIQHKMVVNSDSGAKGVFLFSGILGCCCSQAVVED